MKKVGKIYIVLCGVILVLAGALALTNIKEINDVIARAKDMSASPLIQDGSSEKRAYIVKIIDKSVDFSVRESEQQIRVFEIKKLAEKYGEQAKDWKIQKQQLVFSDDRTFDLLTVQLLKDKSEVETYFDITDSFQKQKPRVTYNAVEFYYSGPNREEYYYDDKHTCAQADGGLITYYKYFDLDHDGVDEIYYRCFQGGSSNGSDIYIYKVTRNDGTHDIVPKLIGTFHNEGARDYIVDRNNDGFLDIVTSIRDDTSACSDPDDCSNAQLLPREIIYYWDNNKNGFTESD